MQTLEYYRAVGPHLHRELEARDDEEFWKDAVRRASADDILELGCGTGRVTEMLAEVARRIVGLDLSGAMLARARRRTAPHDPVGLVRGDMRKLPFVRAFDLVVAPDDPFIHLVDCADRSRAVASAAAALRPGGRLVLEGLWWTPAEEAEARLRGWYRYRRFGRTGEEATTEASFRGRRWTLRELRGRLERAGLRIVRLLGGWDGRPWTPERSRTLLVEATSTDSTVGREPRGARLQGPPDDSPAPDDDHE